MRWSFLCRVWAVAALVIDPTASDHTHAHPHQAFRLDKHNTPTNNGLHRVVSARDPSASNTIAEGALAMATATTATETAMGLVMARTQEAQGEAAVGDVSDMMTRADQPPGQVALHTALTKRGDSRIDWRTSPYLKALDMLLDFALDPKGPFGIDKLVDMLTNGTGTIELDGLNMTRVEGPLTLSIHAISLQGLDTFSTLSPLVAVSAYELDTSFAMEGVMAVVQLEAQVGDNRIDFEVSAKLVGVSMDMRLVLEVDPDELHALAPNQLISGGCLDHAVHQANFTRMALNVSEVAAVQVTDLPPPFNALIDVISDIITLVLQKELVQLVEGVTSPVRQQLNKDILAFLDTACVEATATATDKQVWWTATSIALGVVVLGLVGYAVIGSHQKPVHGQGQSREASVHGMVVCGRPVQLRPALRHAVPTWAQAAVLAIMVTTLFFRLWALRAVVSTVHMAVFIEAAGKERRELLSLNVLDFSFKVMVNYFWSAKAYLVSLILILASGALQIGGLLFIITLWLLPAPAARGHILLSLSQIAKHSFADIVFMSVTTVIFGMKLRIPLSQGSFLRVTMAANPRAGIVAGISSITVLILCTHYLLRLHQQQAKASSSSSSSSSSSAPSASSSAAAAATSSSSSSSSASASSASTSSSPLLGEMSSAVRDREADTQVWSTDQQGEARSSLSTQRTPSHSIATSTKRLAFWLLFGTCSWTLFVWVAVTPVLFSIVTGGVAGAIQATSSETTPNHHLGLLGLFHEVPMVVDSDYKGEASYVAFAFLMAMCLCPLIVLISWLGHQFPDSSLDSYDLKGKFLSATLIGHSLTALDALWLMTAVTSLEINQITQWTLNQQFGFVCEPLKRLYDTDCINVTMTLHWQAYLLLPAALFLGLCTVLAMPNLKARASTRNGINTV